MADFLTVSGWVMTAVFGAVSMYQFVRDYVRGKVWNERARHLQAVKAGLMQLRAMLTEAGSTQEVIKTDATRQFVRQLGHHIVSIEHHIDVMLDDGTTRPA